MLHRDQATTPDDQIAMAIDLNKCMGCQTCSVSCKTTWTKGEGREHMWWNKVNTMPGKGSPKDWEEMGGGFTGRGLKLVLWRLFGGGMRDGDLPTEEDFGEYTELPLDELPYAGEGSETTLPENSPEWMYNWDEDRGAGEHPNSYFFYLPRLCNHCSRPACLEACSRDAIYKREEDGIVLIDEDDCNGYRHCVEACPYKVIYFNAEEGKASIGVEPGDITAAADGGVEVEDADEDRGHGPGEPTVDADAAGGTAQKCIGCYPRVEKGVAPACVRQCPGRARFYGHLDDPETEVHKLVHDWEVALPLHPEYETEPNVYYVPPLSSPKLSERGNPLEEPRIPLEYLESLFGDGVQQALETLRIERSKVREGGESELMEILIGYEWPEDFFGEFTSNPADLTPPGVDEDRTGGDL